MTPHSSRRRPNQRDIARAAGVSQSVVSYVLNENHSVSISPETRQRVLDTIRRLGYIPNKAAQSLRLQKTSTVAAIIPDITNPYYPEFVRGIQDVLQPAGYDLITYNSDGIPDLEHKGVQAAVRAHVDGVIANLFHLGLDQMREMIAPSQPLVLLGDGSGVPDDVPMAIDFVYNDGASAGKLVTNYLIERGHRRIVMLSGKEMTAPRESRLQGYLQALSDHGLPAEESLVFGGEFDQTGGYESMMKALDMDPLPDAVFAANDLMAIGALRACRERGIRVPDQIAVAGYDDIPAAALVNPPLTTLNQFSRDQGHRTAELLLDRLNYDFAGPVRRELMPYELVIRESA